MSISFHQMASRNYSTRDAAKSVGISRATLQAWISSRKISAPKTIKVGRVSVRLWSVSDIERLREQKARIYWKGQGRPRKKSN